MSKPPDQREAELERWLRHTAAEGAVPTVQALRQRFRCGQATIDAMLKRLADRGAIEIRPGPWARRIVVRPLQARPVAEGRA